MIEIIITSLLGILIGLITGITPGIHVNAVAAFILANSKVFHLSYFSLSIFIVSLTIAHAILDFIPSIFLGVPGEDVLSILPGHKLAKEGRGIEAIKITSLGGVIGCGLLLGLLPILFFTIPKIFSVVKPAIPLLLISIISILIFKEKKNWWKAVIIVALAASFGIATLKEGEVVLYSAFTGMFGISTMLFSLNEKSIFPEQRESKINLTHKEIAKSSVTSFISSTLLSLVPALGSSQAAATSQLFSKKPESFLLSLGVVNVCVGLISIISLNLIGKARSGAGAVIQELIGNVTVLDTITFVIIGFIVSVLSAIIAIYASRFCSKFLHKLNYKIISIVIIIFLISLAFYFDGIRGLFNLTIGTLIGYLTIYFGVNRSHCMGFLIIPTLFYYLNFM